MEQEFVSYEVAVALKELGFDEEVLEYYYTDTRELCDIMKEIKAPLKQQVLRWFREKYGLYATIIFRTSMEDNNEYWDWLIKGEEVVYRHFKTYEEAENACIDKLIELAKQQSNTDDTLLKQQDNGKL